MILLLLTLLLAVIISMFILIKIMFDAESVLQKLESIVNIVTKD